MTTYSLTIEWVIPGEIDRVFDAWLDPQSVMQWMRPGPGMTVPRVTIDARVGGRYTIVMASPDGEIPHTGEYRVIDRPSRLAFTWVSEPARNSVVTVDCERVSDTRTRVILSHEKLPSQQNERSPSGRMGQDPRGPGGRPRVTCAVGVRSHGGREPLRGAQGRPTNGHRDARRRSARPGPDGTTTRVPMAEPAGDRGRRRTRGSASFARRSPP